MKSFYTPNDVEAVVGLSYRQIQYWDTTGFIKPSYKKHGRYRCYSFEDLVQIEVVHKVRAAKVSIQKIRKSFLPSLRKLIKQATQPLVNYRISVLKSGTVLMYTGDLIVEGDLQVLVQIDLDKFAELAEEKCEKEEKSLEPLVS